MKSITKLLVLICMPYILISCGGNETEIDKETNVKLVKVLTHTNSSGVSRDLNITYNSENNIQRIDTDSYYKLYSYVNSNIVKIESITLPNTPYYTIYFTYINDRVVATKRENHYNNTVMYVDYFYSNDGRISATCMYDSEQEKADGLCKKSYAMSYAGGTTNYSEKTFYREVGAIVFETKTKWEYDTKPRPFFGEAINTISLPYATNGLEVDWEIVYSLNNPTKRTQKDNTTGVYNISKTFDYTYDNDGTPLSMETKKYDLSTGNVSYTLKSTLSYNK